MRVVISSGPAMVPIDAVRRISNFSTGEIGGILAETFADAGHAVVLFRSRGATAGAVERAGVEVREFSTNAELETLFGQVEGDVILHAAALSDFAVAEVTDGAGARLEGRKISSSVGELNVRLVAAPKVIGTLRGRFPAARIVGWKYELEGDRAAAVRAGRRQMDSARTDACVVNGAAYGAGFGLLTASGGAEHFTGKRELAASLVAWAERSVSSSDDL